MQPGVTTIAQPLAAIQRYFEVALFLLVATSVLTLVSTGRLDPVSTVVPVVALGVKAWRWWRGHGPELSHRLATWLVILYLLFFPVDLWVFSRVLATGAPNEALYAALLASVHLMLFAIVVRLYSARTTRDYLFLAMLAFAAMLVAAILTVDTIFLIFFVLFLVLAVATFVGLEMRRSAEGAVAPPLAEGTPAARRVQRALNVTSVSVALSSLLLGTLLFFLLPRFTAGYMSGLNLQPSLISGFSDDVELGQIGQIKQNTAVVMRVRMEGPPEDAQGVYWRGLALTQFDGRRWFNENEEAVVVLPERAWTGWYRLGFPAAVDRRSFMSHTRRVQYTILLEPIASDTIFVAAEVFQVRGKFSHETDRAGRPSRRSYLLLDDTRSLSNPYHNLAKILYEGVSRVPAVPVPLLRAVRDPQPGEMPARYLQLPALDPRVAELARQLTANAHNTYDRAAAIERYFRTQFGYTLDLSQPPNDDPLAYFLFTKRAGHCEYFATAMTVMLRSLGIPARYVNGFLTGEYNDIGRDYIVRASDAHSWVEVYFPDYGWIKFDPTPPSDSLVRGFFGRLGFYWDWFELAWSEWVINYDFAHQILLAQGLQRASREWTERARQYLREKRRETMSWFRQAHARVAAGGALFPLAMLMLLAALMLLRIRRVREWLGARWTLLFGARGEASPRLATIYYQQMLRLLARRGWRKSAAQTPREFAGAITLAEVGEPVGRLTALYESARFGGRVTDAERMSGLLAAIRLRLRRR
jgi:transglutaminase-like putative cysteine protease